MDKPINVLSFFDGMSCGMLALERARIKVGKYYAAEIDPYAIKVSKKNYPEIEHLGSVTDIDCISHDFEKMDIDLFIGGSPCQGFSFAGKQLNFEDPRSKLFFEFVRVLEEIRLYNPDVKFLLENVKMKKESQDVITGYLGVEPVEINSDLVSAQNRKRLYWTNIPYYGLPEDKGIFLKDIVHEFNDDIIDELTPNFNINPSGKGMNGNVRSVNNPKSTALTTNKDEGSKIFFPIEKFTQVDRDKSLSILETYQKKTVKDYFEKSRGQIVFEGLTKYIVPFDKTLQILDKEVEKGKVGYFRQDSQANRVYYIHGKSVTLCGDAGGGAGGGAAKMGQYLFGCITPDRIEKRQNGQRFNEGNKFYTLTAQDKHGILIEGYIRKLTPIECERLQTVPDNYTEGVSDSQRYKMLGNGWTVDVIAHLFQGLKYKPETLDLL